MNILRIYETRDSVKDTEGLKLSILQHWTCRVCDETILDVNIHDAT